MRYRWLIPALVGGVLALANAAAQPAASEEDATVITSDKLTFDYLKQYAVFENNVVVVDADMRLTSDKLAIWFNEKNEVTLIKADGNLHIEQQVKTAMAGEAVYDVVAGKITLTVDPRLQRGSHYLEGTKITYWRDQELLECEPAARLVIRPGDDQGVDKNLFGN